MRTKQRRLNNYYTLNVAHYKIRTFNLDQLDTKIFQFVNDRPQRTAPYLLIGVDVHTQMSESQLYKLREF